MDRALELTREVLRWQGEGSAVNQPRRRIRYPGGLFHFMAGAVPDTRSVGLKCYATSAHGATFAVLLFDTESTELLAIIGADWLGRIRTGAASAVATDVLARPDSSVLGVVGAGGQAETQIEAQALVRDFKLIKIFSRAEIRREDLARRLAQKLEGRIEPVTSAREAVEGSDVVTTITTSREPVFDGVWLAPGTHINAAGSNRRTNREIDDQTVAAAGVIAVDSIQQAEAESGDLIHAVETGVLQWDRVSELGAIIAGNAPGRENRDEITLFESQGIAIEDVMVARAIYDAAVQAGRGRRMELS